MLRNADILSALMKIKLTSVYFKCLKPAAV